MAWAATGRDAVAMCAELRFGTRRGLDAIAANRRAHSKARSPDEERIHRMTTIQELAAQHFNGDVPALIAFADGLLNDTYNGELGMNAEIDEESETVLLDAIANSPEGPDVE